MDLPQKTEQSTDTLGVNTTVMFPMFNKSLEGKVDTGATTTSLHAVNLKVNGSRVSFQNEMLSQNIITLPLAGTQEVHSADYGGDKRPIVRLDIEINGKPLKGVSMNLNDRSQMDSKLLIGQDVLEAGQFKVDVSKPEAEQKPDTAEMTSERPMREGEEATEEQIYEAVRVLADSGITLREFVKYLQTLAVNRIKG